MGASTIYQEVSVELHTIPSFQACWDCSNNPQKAAHQVIAYAADYTVNVYTQSLVMWKLEKKTKQACPWCRSSPTLQDQPVLCGSTLWTKIGISHAAVGFAAFARLALANVLSHSSAKTTRPARRTPGADTFAGSPPRPHGTLPAAVGQTDSCSTLPNWHRQA